MSQNNDINNRTVTSNFLWRFSERCGAQGVSLIVSIVLARLIEIEILTKYIKSYLQENESAINSAIKKICFEDQWICGGYGNYNHDILETIMKVYQNDGIPLDPTYTGKAFWGMKEYLKNQTITGKNILFVHTGGVPLFFDIMISRNPE